MHGVTEAITLQNWDDLRIYSRHYAEDLICIGSPLQKGYSGLSGAYWNRHNMGHPEALSRPFGSTSSHGFHRNRLPPTTSGTMAFGRTLDDYVLMRDTVREPCCEVGGGAQVRRAYKQGLDRLVATGGRRSGIWRTLRSSRPRPNACSVTILPRCAAGC